MHEVFINYRTGDGDEAAALLEQALAARFGEQRAFRAASSIAPGEAYPERLLGAVRSSSVLLAIMGPGWAEYPELRDPDDWVRREILEATKHGTRVIPILKGRKTDRLDPAHLPRELAGLAEVQSLRLETRDNGADLRRIGDALARLVPALKAADRSPANTGTGSVHNSVGGVHGTAVQSNQFTGDAGTVIKGAQGPVHTGKGDINTGHHFSGDGATYIQGDSHGDIGHHFGRGGQ